MVRLSKLLPSSCSFNTPTIFGSERDGEKMEIRLKTNSSSWRRKAIRYGRGSKDEFEDVFCKLQPGFFVRSTFLPHLTSTNSLILNLDSCVFISIHKRRDQRDPFGGYVRNPHSIINTL